VMGYGLDGWSLISGRSKIFLISVVSRAALGPTHRPIHWATEGNFPGGEVAGVWSWPLTFI
jgi:hypothetical protein